MLLESPHHSLEVDELDASLQEGSTLNQAHFGSEVMDVLRM